MNERAFTLFTALISFILIVLSSLLVSNMTLTGRNTSEIISSLEEQSEMQAIADLARADAMQAFNYHIRYRLEEYFIDPANDFPMDLGPNKSWKDIQKDFATAFFANPDEDRYQFAEKMTRNIEAILEDPPQIKGYHTTLINRERNVLRTVLQEAVANSVKRPDFDFFQVVGCETGDPANCNPGTFYINIDLSELSDEAYEKLPQIRVENLATGRVIREPILPRAMFRIYVPLRIFKVLAYAKELATKSLLEPGFHSAVENYYGLGMCDPGRCHPRTTYQSPALGMIPDKLCPGDGGGRRRGIDTPSQVMNKITFSPDFYAKYGVKSYQADFPQEIPFRTIMAKVICEKAKPVLNSSSWASLGSPGEFKMLGSKCVQGNAALSKIMVDVEADDTVTVYMKSGDRPPLDNYSLQCTRAEKIGTTLAFRETNDKYIVNQNLYTENSAFRFRVVAVYQPSTQTWNCYSRCASGGLLEYIGDPVRCIGPSCTSS